MATLFSYFKKVPSKKNSADTSPSAGDKADSKKSQSPKENAKERLTPSPTSKGTDKMSSKH